jgi:xylitol oxidase
MRNWAGNRSYRARSIARPRSFDQLQELVRGATAVRAVGSRHSFNELVDTDGTLVVLDEMPIAIRVDDRRERVSIEGPVRYGDLVGPLDDSEVALHNLAALPHISVFGGCATGTHGSGNRSRILASAITSLRVVRADGELVTLGDHRDGSGDEIDASAVSLGAIGVIVGGTLSVEPTYRVRQFVYEGLSDRAFGAHFSEIVELADHVSFFSTWRTEDFDQVWLKQRLPGKASTDARDAPPEIFGARLAGADLHPIPGMSAESCTPQRGVPGPWHARLPHFRMEFTPSSGKELQTEYFVDRRDAVDAHASLRALRSVVEPILQVAEVRTIAADRLWLSPAYRRESVAFHFTWLPDWASVRRVLPRIETTLAPFHPRPHWGKLFTLPDETVRAAYPRRRDFAAFARAMDPDAKFANDFLRRHVFGEGVNR